ncbi:MAG: substrate-binding domain-containing protein, partial [Actinobacteria bacterium]|nr:substrate-binding domain-containing protein [Actinomycetota bacterium]
MIMFNNDDDLDKEKEFIKDLISINVAGVIITPAKGDSENLKILKKFGIPFVLINRYINKNEDNYVVVDDFKAGLIATDYLIKNRSKKIIYLNGFEEISPAKERLRGYKECLKKNGLPVIKKYIYKEIMKQIDGYEITKKILLEHKPPFSILCISDYVATGVIKYLTEKGVKIPEEISVMGIDNVEKSFFLIPSLTTIDISQKMLGVKSVNILFNLMNKKHYDNEYRIVLEPKLIVRETA